MPKSIEQITFDQMDAIIAEGGSIQLPPEERLQGKMLWQWLSDYLWVHKESKTFDLLGLSVDFFVYEVRHDCVHFGRPSTKRVGDLSGVKITRNGGERLYLLSTPAARSPAMFQAIASDEHFVSVVRFVAKSILEPN